MEKLDENSLALLFWISKIFFAKTSRTEHLDDRHKINLLVDHFFEFTLEFYLVGRGDVASENGLLVMFEVLFADFKNLGDSVFADFTKLIGDVVEQKDIIVIDCVFFHIFSLSKKGVNSRPSTMVLMSL